LELEEDKWSVTRTGSFAFWEWSLDIIIKWMGVGPSTGLIVVVVKDKIAVFREPLCNAFAYKSCFTADLSFSRPIWLGVSDSVYYHLYSRQVA
jgi:hypothetical protein